MRASWGIRIFGSTALLWAGMILPLTHLMTYQRSCGQEVKLPAEVKVPVGRLAAVTVDWSGDDVKWDAPADLDCFREYDPDGKRVRLRLIGYAPGKYRLTAVAAKGGRLSDFAVCIITIGEPVPPVPPGPVPPGPTPPEPPTPIPTTGLTVLILFDKATEQTMPKAQQDAIYDQGIRKYLNAKCPLGPDGKKKEWAIWDVKADTSNDPSTALKAMVMRPHPQLPWIVITNGKTFFEGPMPATTVDTMALLQKWGG